MDTCTLGDNAFPGRSPDAEEPTPIPTGVPRRSGAAGPLRAAVAGADGRDLGISPEALRNWLKQADLGAGVRTDGLTTAEREELGRLRRENRVLRQEREILVKAAAFFARETERTP